MLNFCYLILSYDEISLTNSCLSQAPKIKWIRRHEVPIYSFVLNLFFYYSGPYDSALTTNVRSHIRIFAHLTNASEHTPSIRDRDTKWRYHFISAKKHDMTFTTGGLTYTTFCLMRWSKKQWKLWKICKTTIA